MNATPAKLRNGTWGARAPNSAKSGDILTITTRAGKSWQARVTCVVWRGDAALCITESLDRAPCASEAPRGSTRSRRTGCSCGSREDQHGQLVNPETSCFSCRHDHDC